MLRKLSDLLAKTRKDEGGFTLIELLVVILIIGILAAIALPSFLSQAGKGADATAKANLRSSVTKVEACAAESGTYVGCTTATNLAIGDFAVTVDGAVTATAYTLQVVKAASPAATAKMEKTWKITSNAGQISAIS